MGYQNPGRNWLNQIVICTIIEGLRHSARFVIGERTRIGTCVNSRIDRQICPPFNPVTYKSITITSGFLVRAISIPSSIRWVVNTLYEKDSRVSLSIWSAAVLSITRMVEGILILLAMTICKSPSIPGLIKSQVFEYPKPHPLPVTLCKDYAVFFYFNTLQSPNKYWCGNLRKGKNGDMISRQKARELFNPQLSNPWSVDYPAQAATFQ